MRDLSAFEHEVDELLREEWRTYEAEIGAHISDWSKAGRLGSGLDAHHRVEIAHARFRETVAAVMKAALDYHLSEGTPAHILIAAVHSSLVELASRTAKAASSGFRREYAATGADEPDQVRRLGTINVDLVSLLALAEENARAGRVGFDRHVPRSLLVTAMQRARGDPWLVLSPLLALGLGMVAEAATGFVARLADWLFRGAP